MDAMAAVDRWEKREKRVCKVLMGLWAVLVMESVGKMEMLERKVEKVMMEKTEVMVQVQSCT